MSPTRRISEITRRDIFEALSSLDPWGRLEEVEFLDRLYDLDELPSYDGRFNTAREDIIQHRVRNLDWDDDWVFYDDRFELAEGDDEVLLRFLCELVHPVVRPDQDEVTRIVEKINHFLAPDGYRLEPGGHLSGRPIFKSSQVDPAPVLKRLRPEHFTENPSALVTTIARLAELDGSELEQAVLRAAEVRLEEPEYDNWDGGTYYHTLTLSVPVDLFARLGDQVQSLEERINDRISSATRSPDKHRITAVVVQPGLTGSSSEQVADVVVARAERPVPQFWAPGQFRLFISHVTSFKQRATALRGELSRYHISGFVAHETIEPGELWQREIEAALRSMHAFAALITPDFCESKWTDQEVGWALGAGVCVLPVRRGADPYGFLGEIQGIQGLGKKVHEVANGIFEAFLRHPDTQETLLDALVAGFEESGSFQEARANLTLLERAPGIPSPLRYRIEVATRTNDQIADSHGVPERVQRLIRKVGVLR